MAKFPGPLGLNLTAGLTTTQLQNQALREAERLARKQLGKRLSALALKKAGSRLFGKIAIGSPAWKKALVHIGEHFDETALASKAAHAVFEPRFRNPSAVEALLKQAAGKPGRKRLTQATIGGNPRGRPVVVLEREFADVIGTELRQGKGVIQRTPCKILRIVVDFTGKPVTAYPVTAFL